MMLIGFSLLTMHSSVAQQLSVNQATISNGGGRSSGGKFALTGTIGQPTAGSKLSGGKFGVESGFWQAISLVQTPGSPTLQISINNGEVTIFWPAETSGFALEYTTSLTTPAIWQTVSGVENNSFTPALIHQSGMRFYRLRKAP